MATTIRVADRTADDLHELKKRGESYDDVVQRLLADAQLNEQGSEKEDNSAQ